MAFTVLYLAAIVLVPLLTLPIKSFSDGWDFFWTTIRDPRVIASYRLTLGASFVAACVNGVLGIVVAWVLVRYEFPGRRIVDAMIDLPFALPTAVAGITLTSLYAPNGWFGQYLVPYGIQGVFSPLGITIALIFIGLPFVVRTLQPVIADLDVELEEVATSLGANRVQVVFRVILPYLYPAWLIGFGMAFARAIGEYRFGRLHRGQHADEDGDRLAPHHHEADAVPTTSAPRRLRSYCCFSRSCCCSSSTRSRAGARSGWGTDCVCRT